VLDKLLAPALEAVPGLDVHGIEHVVQTPIFIWENLKEVIIPLAIGISVFVLGAWPDLFGVRRKGPDIFQVRLPRWLGVDYWYERAAKGSLELVYAASRTLAPVRDRAIRDLREGTINLSATIQTEFVPKVREYQGDIAVGALVVAVSLTLFLIMTLL
jgi:hypothetical protein